MTDSHSFCVDDIMALCGMRIVYSATSLLVCIFDFSGRVEGCEEEEAGGGKKLVTRGENTKKSSPNIYVARRACIYVVFV